MMELSVNARQSRQKSQWLTDRLTVVISETWFRLKVYRLDGCTRHPFPVVEEVRSDKSQRYKLGHFCINSHIGSSLFSSHAVRYSDVQNNRTSDEYRAYCPLEGHFGMSTLRVYTLFRQVFEILFTSFIFVSKGKKMWDFGSSRWWRFLGCDAV